jgi:hypothetical protein
MDVTLALTVRPDSFAYEIEIPAGRATLGREFHEPIVAALGSGPLRVRDLLGLPGLPDRRRNPAELVAMLIGSEQAIAIAPRHGRPDARSIRFNAASARRLGRPESLSTSLAIASDVLGAGFPCDALELLVHARLQQAGTPDFDAWAAELCEGRERTDRQRLRDLLARIAAERGPVWRKAGAL